MSSRRKHERYKRKDQPKREETPASPEVAPVERKEAPKVDLPPRVVIVR